MLTPMNDLPPFRLFLDECLECRLCVDECRFLQTHGTPKVIAANRDREDVRISVFECSLCGLCSKVCPRELNPSAMFLELRREAASVGARTFPEHATILAYERRGMSRRYTWYGLPEGCRAVFFPGCGLSGTRSERVLQVYETLRRSDPALGVVLDCCGKPSHDLGRSEYFQQAFDDIRGYLLDHGVQRVLVACPNCHKVFKEYGAGLAVETVYERLAENVGVGAGKAEGVVTIHDPCAVRTESDIHDSVRSLVELKGLTIREMSHSREQTLCCGQGGSVPFLSPELATTWKSKREAEVEGDHLVTYCAGCAGYLGTVVPTSHVLDLLYEPGATLAGKAPVAKAPLTYWKRLRLKSRLRGTVRAVHERERSFPERAGSKTVLKAGVVALLLAAILALHFSGAARHLDQESLRGWIEGYGMLAPALYMLIYAAAPSLLLPGLPLTIAGGMLFGPLWGVVYTMAGSTAGACVAFLVARYTAGEWIRSRLHSPRWKRLDQAVERNGWKVVLLTRLVPLFPYNLLNYAFGLTRIPFTRYALATFFGMLPACVGFVVFSSSLWDVLSGKVSGGFIVGCLLVAGILLVPVVYTKFRRKETARAHSISTGGKS